VYYKDDDDDYPVEQYVVTLPSRATFLRLIDLLSLTLSFVQVAKTISQEREMFAGGRSMLINVARRDVTVNTRLLAVLGLEAFSKVLQRSWAYAVAADSSHWRQLLFLRSGPHPSTFDARRHI
jgi:hypothetical protein